MPLVAIVLGEWQRDAKLVQQKSAAATETESIGCYAEPVAVAKV